MQDRYSEDSSAGQLIGAVHGLGQKEEELEKHEPASGTRQALNRFPMLLRPKKG